VSQQRVLFILICYITRTVKLQYDKLRESLCEYNSWIDRKFWQRFFIKFLLTYF